MMCGEFSLPVSANSVNIIASDFGIRTQKLSDCYKHPKIAANKEFKFCWKWNFLLIL